MKSSLIISSLLLGFLGVITLSCNKKAVIIAPQSSSATINSSVAMLPKAKIYRTNGDYDKNVPITLNQERNKVVSYPAPSDIGEFCTPVPLDNGFLLDRRGITATSAFINMTYSDYAALENAPRPSELLEMVIPDARVTEIYLLPYRVGEAQKEIPQINLLIKDGMKDCEKIFP